MLFGGLVLSGIWFACEVGDIALFDDLFVLFSFFLFGSLFTLLYLVMFLLVIQYLMKLLNSFESQMNPFEVHGRMALEVLKRQKRTLEPTLKVKDAEIVTLVHLCRTSPLNSHGQPQRKYRLYKR